MVDLIRRNVDKNIIADVLLWCILAALIIMSAINIDSLWGLSSVSLRYKEPVSGQTAWLARQYAALQEDESVFWPTFWRETQLQVTGDLRKTNARCIYYSGNAGQVWRAQYLAGSAPGVTDGAGCAVSSGLAWELWGGFDVIGKKIEVDGAERTVRGVFEEDDTIALLAISDEDKSQSYSAVELSGGPSSPTRADAKSFAVASGLGAPDNILIGTPASLVEILSALPLLILAVYGFALLTGALKKYPSALQGALFLALIVFAILLPYLLDALPDRIIPTRWSDFSFWGSLAGQLGDDLHEYMAVEPRLRDVELKTLLLKQAGIACLAVMFAIIVCFRWHITKTANAE